MTNQSNQTTLTDSVEQARSTEDDPETPPEEGGASASADPEGRGEAVEVPPPGDDISIVYRQQGPWRCKTCGEYTWKPYRCTECGKDLAESGGSHAVQRPTVIKD